MANSRIVNTPSQAIPQNGATHKQNTISSTAEDVFVQFTGANARVTLDGSTSPTTSLGFQYPDGSTAYWTRTQALKAKAIRDDSTDVVVEIQELNYL
jgi:hypothetical protein